MEVPDVTLSTKEAMITLRGLSEGLPIPLPAFLTIGYFLEQGVLTAAERHEAFETLLRQSSESHAYVPQRFESDGKHPFFDTQPDGRAVVRPPKDEDPTHLPPSLFWCNLNVADDACLTEFHTL